MDYSLYLVTDRPMAGTRLLEDIVREGIRGGVTVVQLREKHITTRDFIRLALALKRILAEPGIPLIINDRLDVALACEADGVHLGQEDMNCTMARRIVGNKMIVGVSVSNPEEAIRAEADGADYLGAGPVFATPTKSDASPPTGLSGLREIRRVTRIPLVAIGGINRSNAGDMIRCGADGIAVVSAIIASPDPAGAAGELNAVMHAARAAKR